MVMTRFNITIIVIGVLAVTGISAWFFLPKQNLMPAAEVRPVNSDAVNARQQQAKEFFGGKKDYDLKGGQEMQPRW